MLAIRPVLAGIVPVLRALSWSPVRHSVSQDSPTQWRSEAKCRPFHISNLLAIIKMYKYRRQLCQHLHGALLRSGNLLDKIGETGLKPALLEKRWLATLIMICKLGLVQGRA